MKDNLIKSDEIYLQDIVCLNVMKNPNMNNFDLYNQIVEMLDVYDIKTIETIFKLIKMNKQALLN